MHVPARKAVEIIGVSPGTLRKWADNDKIQYIRTPGGVRLYNVSKYINDSTNENNSGNVNTKHKICYCRVSSDKQRDNLERQVQFMRTKFPEHTILTDIGSGINFKRKNFLHILELAQGGNVEEVIVAYRDRLCRFAFELIDWLFRTNGVKLVVLNQNMESTEQTELVEDILSVLTVFNCRINGKRKYKKVKDTSNTNQ